MSLKRSSPLTLPNVGSMWIVDPLTWTEPARI